MTKSCEPRTRTLCQCKRRIHAAASARSCDNLPMHCSIASNSPHMLFPHVLFPPRFLLATPRLPTLLSVICGNKCDLSSERAVSEAEGRALAQKIGAEFFETSAKDKINNEECFFALVRQIRKANDAPAAAAGKAEGKKKQKQDKGKKSKCTIL